MATQLLKIIDPGGTGDYASTAVLAATNMDLVTLDKWLDAKHITSDGSADTGGEAAFNGWESDDTRYINLYVDSAHRHSGVWNTAKYRITSTGNFISGILVKDIGSGSAKIFITGFQISIDTGSGANAYCVSVGNTSIATAYIAYNICKQVTPGGRGHGITCLDMVAGGMMYVYNNIVYNCNASASVGISMNENGSTMYAENNTVHSCYTGIKRTFGDLYLKNNLIKCYGVNASYTDITGTIAGQSYNATSDATATGTGGRINQTFTFENEGTYDLRITSADAGARTYGTSTVTAGFTDDITSWTRGATWDIGAYQITNRSSGGTIPVLINHYKQQGVM